MTAVHQAVIGVRSAVKSLDEDALPSFARGEENIIKEYKDALSQGDLYSETSDLLEGQKTALRGDRRSRAVDRHLHPRLCRRRGRQIRQRGQALWASGEAGDVEESCEDEGAQCDNEGNDTDTEEDLADREPWLGACERWEEGQPNIGWENDCHDLEDEVRVFYPRPPQIDFYSRNFLEAKKEQRIADSLQAIVARGSMKAEARR